MQSGKIKHWNEDKGYGFIDVDHQQEDVFFHISKVRSSTPLSIGQQVYFNSERNDKNQLRALEVTSTALSLQDSSVPASVPRTRTVANTESPTHSSRQSQYNHKNNRHTNSNKRTPLSTLFSLIAIIAVAVYFFGDIKPSFFGDDLSTTSRSPTPTTSASVDETNVNAITGDTQIDNTIALIRQGGPYPYPNKDGSTFYNRESRLPTQPSGYYREYTVPTLGISDRGARRIVTGGNPPSVYYLTVDHYDSFSPLQVR